MLFLLSPTLNLQVAAPKVGIFTPQGKAAFSWKYFTVLNFLINTSWDSVNSWGGSCLCPDKDICGVAVRDVQFPEQHYQWSLWVKGDDYDSDASGNTAWDKWTATCRHQLWRSVRTPVDYPVKFWKGRKITFKFFQIDFCLVLLWPGSQGKQLFLQNPLLWCETALQSKQRGGTWGLVLAGS